MEGLAIEHAAATDQTVLLRIDSDVKVGSKGRIQDDSRLRAALPTIGLLVRSHNRVIMIGHRGRPKGQRDDAFSLRPVARRLSKLMKQPVPFADLDRDSGPEARVNALRRGQVLLLENLRFDPGEEANDTSFAKRLASLADCFVNDSFANAHRSHASVVGVPALLPSYFGLRFTEEVQRLSSVRSHPSRPLIAVVGGAKISSKAAIIKELCRVADAVLVGGALANTLLFAQNHPVGRSLIEKELAATARDLLQLRLRIPIDVVTSTSLSGERRQTKGVGAVKDEDMILDIGPDTVKLYSKILSTAKTIVWGGPMGFFEDRRFSEGTFRIARAIAANRGITIAGGGETLDAIRRTRLKKHFTFVSMGGGAMLQFLEGRPLPGIEAIKSSYEQRHKS